MICEDLLALADELEGMDCHEGCRSCPADGTKDCRGDLSCEEAVARAAARRIREIVEHDECEVTTVSAYDLLPDEDRKAISWVREHGGIEQCEAFVHQGTREHGCLLKVAEMLGTSIYDGTGNADALLDKLEKRLMPEGMEWPKVDGESVDFKTFYEPSLGVLEAVSIYNNGACEVMSHDGIVKNVTEIHVFKPKVVDADGVEIRVGDTVYVVGWDESLTVKGFDDYGLVLVDYHNENSLGYKPSSLTHRAPVLAADGRPLRVGETVYKLEDSRPYTVKRIDGDHVYINAGGKALDIWTFPGKLTHEQPDIWERLEDDANKNPFDYCKDVGHRLDTCENAERFKSRDLVRRARKMAERGE